MEDKDKIKPGTAPEKKKTVAETIAELQEQIQTLAKGNKDLTEKDKKNQENIAKLLAIADEGRKENFDAKSRVKIAPKVLITLLDKKVVVGSRTIMDEVYKTPDGKWFENQTHEYVLEDGTKKILNLPEYTRTRERVLCEVVRVKEIPEKMADDGTKYFEYEVKTPDDRLITLDYKFIN